VVETVAGAEIAAVDELPKTIDEAQSLAGKMTKSVEDIHDPVEIP